MRRTSTAAKKASMSTWTMNRRAAAGPGSAPGKKGTAGGLAGRRDRRTALEAVRAARAAAARAAAGLPSQLGRPEGRNGGPAPRERSCFGHGVHGVRIPFGSGDRSPVCQDDLYGRRRRPPALWNLAETIFIRRREERNGAAASMGRNGTLEARSVLPQDPDDPAQDPEVFDLERLEGRVLGHEEGPAVSPAGAASASPSRPRAWPTIISPELAVFVRSRRTLSPSSM